jgi:(2R)-sulfolactate sulfo-lyase subunit alpha
MRPSFLVHASGDAVGVAVRDIEPGPGVQGRVQNGGGHIEIAARDTIPLGHKIALRAIARGEHVIEYGTPIGRATADIAAGQHVHVHNLKGERWA